MLQHASCLAVLSLVVIGQAGRRLKTKKNVLRNEGFALADHVEPKTAEFGSWGVDLDGRDLSISPGDNFYMYANGEHLRNLRIPDDMSEWGTFDAAAQRSFKDCRQILEDAKISSRLGKFYASFMDMEQLEKLDLKPLEAGLNEIQAIQSSSDFAAIAGKSSIRLLPSPFSFSIRQEPIGADPPFKLTVALAELGMSAPNYYVEKQFQRQRDAYAKHVHKMLKMLGWEEPANTAKVVMSLEERMAAGVLSLDEVQHLPDFDWDVMLSALGIPPNSSNVTVEVQGAANAAGRVLASANIAELRAWAAYHISRIAANFLPQKFQDAIFDFRKTVIGTTVATPRWQTAVESLNHLMGDAVGELYVAKHFSEKRRVAVEQLILNLKSALQQRLWSATWKSGDKMLGAIMRVDALKILVGHAKEFLSYDGLHVDRDDLFGNVERALAFNWQHQVNITNLPVNPDVWYFPPQIVNAYSFPRENKIAFPASVLQPPFFDPDADESVNYGALGTIIGHEMTHGISPRELVAFDERAEDFKNQIENFRLHMHGVHHVPHPENAIEESTCDLGGLKLSLIAYRLAANQSHSMMWREPYVGPRDDGLEGIRRFFLGWSQVMRTKIRSDRLQERLQRDAHPPEEMRVNLPMSNLESWYRAFYVAKDNSNFVPRQKRVPIW